MKSFSLTHLSNRDLTSGLFAAAARERVGTAELVAYIAEFDARSLYRSAGYPSMYLYCEGELRLSPAAAYKRITAARVGRQFPVVLQALADGRLNLTGVNLIAAYLSSHNAESLLAAAYHQAKPEIERMLAERFPRSESLALIETHQAARPAAESSPADAASSSLAAPAPLVMNSSCQLAPERVEVREQEEPKSFVAPLATNRFSMHLSFGQEMHDDLRHAQDLLGHTDSGVVAVLHRGLQSLIRELEKRKFAATERPRESSGMGPESRSLPAQVRREVWARDSGRCTFVGENGNRCPARAGLEFDHLQPVALGGQSITSNVRLLCRAHNQYVAEQVFGAEHMSRKRQEAQEARLRDQSPITSSPETS